jgi:hypothetical protein
MPLIDIGYLLNKYGQLLMVELTSIVIRDFYHSRVPLTQLKYIWPFQIRESTDQFFFC